MKQPDTSKRPRSTFYAVVVPKTINWATFCYIMLAVINFIVFNLFIQNLGEVTETVTNMNPDLLQNQVDDNVRMVQLVVNGSHVFFGTLAVLLAFMIRQDWDWVRIVATMVFILAVLETIHAWLSPMNVPAVLPHATIPMVIVQSIMLLLHTSIIALLWLPASSRAFFASEK